MMVTGVGSKGSLVKFLPHTQGTHKETTSKKLEWNLATNPRKKYSSSGVGPWFLGVNTNQDSPCHTSSLSYIQTLVFGEKIT